MTEVLLTGLRIGESARWHDGRLWLSNWGARQILAVDLDGNAEAMATVPTTMPFSIDWLPDGRLLVVAGPEGRLLRQEPDGSLVLPGSFPVHDLPDLGVDLPEGPYATVAGLVLDRLGRIPGGGETVAVGDWRIDVLEVDRNTIERLRLRPRGDTPDG